MKYLRSGKLPQRWATCLRINTCPDWHVPSVDVLTLANDLEVLTELTVWKLNYSILVETNVETEVPVEVSVADDVSVNSNLNTLVVYSTNVVHELEETS